MEGENQYYNRSSSHNRLASRQLSSQLQLSSLHQPSYSHQRSTTPNSVLFDQSVLRIKENQESQFQRMEGLIRENQELKKYSTDSVAQIKKELQSALNEIVQIKQENALSLRRLMVEISSSEQEIIRLNARLADESNQKSKIHQIIDELSKQNDVLRDEIRTSELAANTHKKELENRILEMNGNISRANSRVKELEIEKNELQSKLIHFNAKNERPGTTDLLEILDKISTENSLLKNEVFDLTILLSERNRIISTQDQTLSARQSSIQTLTTFISSLQDQLQQSKQQQHQQQQSQQQFQLPQQQQQPQHQQQQQQQLQQQQQEQQQHHQQQQQYQQQQQQQKYQQQQQQQQQLPVFSEKKNQQLQPSQQKEQYEFQDQRMDAQREEQQELNDQINQETISSVDGQNNPNQKSSIEEESFMACFDNPSFSFQNNGNHHHILINQNNFNNNNNNENNNNNSNECAEFGKSTQNQSRRTSDVNIGLADSQITHRSGAPSDGVPKFESDTDDEFKGVINPLQDSGKQGE